MERTAKPNEVEVVFRDTFVHVMLPDNFELAPETLLPIWIKVSELCGKHNCNRVLSEGRVSSRRLKPWDAYDSGTRASEIRGLRHACLFYDYEPDELSDFFRTVSSNRGVFVDFFTDRASAFEWLGIEPVD